MAERPVFVLGPTGAIGRHVVSQLAASLQDGERLMLLTRRDLGDSVPAGAEQCIVDFDKQDTWPAAELSRAAALFHCLGTTRKDAGSAEAFERIDRDIPLRVFSTLPTTSHVLAVSAVNASSGSWFLYPRVKGEIEEGLRKCGFARLTIARPGLLDREEKARWNEKLFSFIGTTKSADVAKALVADWRAKDRNDGERILSDADLRRAGQEKE